MVNTPHMTDKICRTLSVNDIDLSKENIDNTSIGVLHAR